MAVTDCEILLGVDIFYRLLLSGTPCSGSVRWSTSYGLKACSVWCRLIQGTPRNSGRNRSIPNRSTPGEFEYPTMLLLTVQALSCSSNLLQYYDKVRWRVPTLINLYMQGNYFLPRQEDPSRSVNTSLMDKVPAQPEFFSDWWYCCLIAWLPPVSGASF